LLETVPLLLSPEFEFMGVVDGSVAPHFNPDIENAQSMPTSASNWRDLVARADALILSSPEYAGGIPGAFKNALDWLVGDPRFYQKPVATFAASERSIGAADALRLVLKTMSADVVDGACISLPLIGQTRTPEAILDDPSFKQAIVAALDTLAQHVNAKLRTEGPI
jgi:NAD(P)H-dependent FMN reductase